MSLCGAGAGGYAVIILKRGSVRSDLFTILTSFQPSNTSSSPSSSSSSSSSGNQALNYDSVFHNNGLNISSVSIDTKGITTKEFLDNDNASTSTSTLTLPSRIPHTNTRRLADYLHL